MRLQIDVVVWRGPIAESRHRLQAVVCDRAGRRLSETGEADLSTSFRSAAKPFQLLPLVERGHADRWGFRDEELAVMCASHTGSPYHVALVRGILERLELSPDRLACGFHEPLDAESQAHLAAHPEERSPLYNNCSGKHAGMLCLAKSEGWPIEGYELASHPLQQLMRRTVAEVCGCDPASLAVAVDGCSVSVFGLPLAAMARGYAALAGAGAEGDARERALARIRGAMLRYPRAVGGAGRFSTALMEASPERCLAKGGAEGLECVALPERGLGVAVKCEDGQMRGVPPAVIALLEQVGALTGRELERLAEWRRPVIRNHAGLEVGALEATIRILSPAGT